MRRPGQYITEKSRYSRELSQGYAQHQQETEKVDRAVQETATKPASRIIEDKGDNEEIDPVHRIPLAETNAQNTARLVG